MRIKIAQQNKSKFKAMLVFFVIKNPLIMENWVPDGVTMNQHYYRKVLKTCFECIEKRVSRVEAKK